MTYLPQNSRVVYHSRMNQTTRRNFEVFTAVDFLAAVTRHIPDKGAQIVKYYGWYSNKCRSQRAKPKSCHSELVEESSCRMSTACGVSSDSAQDRATIATAGLPVNESPAANPQSAIGNPQSKIPRRIPSRTWRGLIKKIWNTDPLLCPKCSGEMRLISLIEDRQVIEDILRHLSLWEEPDGPSGQAPPEPPFRLELTYEPVDDDQPLCPDESFAE